MSDVISNPVDVNPTATLTVIPGPSGTGAATIGSTPPGKETRAAKRKAAAQARTAARTNAKAARDAARQAAREAKAKAREERKARVAAEKASRKREKRPTLSSAPELWRAAFVAAASQASKVDDPYVAQILKESERDFATFERDLAAQPASDKKLEAMKVARKELSLVFEEDLGFVTNGLMSVRGGKEFVTAAWSEDKATMGKQLLARLTPKTLGHNGPLVDTMKKSMEEYLEADQAYSDLVQANSQATARIASGKRLIQLAIATIQLALKTAQARQAQAECRREAAKTS